MNVNSAVFATDGINRQNSMLMLTGLVDSVETPLAAAIEWSIPFGMPTNLAHDACRPVGWSEPRGIHLAKDCARLVGQFYLPDDHDDRRTINRARAAFIQRHQLAHTALHSDELEAKVADHVSHDAALWYGEATALIDPGLASRIYPDIFAKGAGAVDKDGLVDFAYLLGRTRQVQPGVFREPERDLLLFAHRYFRRSHSLRNSLNPYVLRSFTQTAEEEYVTARLRLDPDMVGHPASASETMELEYWHGPHYSDDIATIPSGVAEHKSRDSERHYSGIDKTQLWWKAPEARPDGDNERMVRTFEVEELVEDPSPGLGAGAYGCRYAHAEYDLKAKAISHFDGAIRAYDGDAYLDRIDRRIDGAGKYADYTKLFRLDGAIPVPRWKAVLTDWFRGNGLIPEYLGAAEADLAEMSAPVASTVPAMIPALSAFLCIERAPGPPGDRIMLLAESKVKMDGQTVDVVEIGRGELGAVMQRWKTPEVTTIAARDGTANLARIVLAGNPPTGADWDGVAKTLGAAILDETEDGALRRVALAISWHRAGMRSTVSIEGEGKLVGSLLKVSSTIVGPEEAASAWIGPFRDALLALAPDLEAPVDCPGSAAKLGRLTLDRSAAVEYEIRLGTAPTDER